MREPSAAAERMSGSHAEGLWMLSNAGIFANSAGASLSRPNSGNQTR